MIRIHLDNFPTGRFTADELAAAFGSVGFRKFRPPGRRQVMDSHEVRGLFMTYLMMAGARVEGDESDALLVEDRVLPMVEDLARIHERLFPRGPGLRFEKDVDA
jgi:hypothetical protein